MRPMPATIPAHQLVVLPLVRPRPWPLPGAALLLGTALPDYAFTVGGYWLNRHSHEIYGPAFMATTLGLVLYVWIETLFAPALVLSLPPRAGRLFRTRGLPDSAKGWAWAWLALMIGAYSHWLFDGFTHYWMWPASELYPRTKLTIGGEIFYLSKVLQIGFSIIGSIWVIAWCIQCARLAHALPAERLRTWPRRLAIAGLATLVGAALGVAVGLAIWGTPTHSRAWVFLWASPMAAGGFAGMTAVSAWILRRERREQASVSSATSSR